MLLGVYVLGGLRGRQEAKVRAHLLYCARCWAEYEELAEVPALLDLISGEEATGNSGTGSNGAGSNGAQASLASVPRPKSAQAPADSAPPADDGGEQPGPMPLRRVPLTDP